LEIEVSNLDLAGVDALLLREPQFGGRLNASATVTGTLEAPLVDAKFQVTQGGFRQFTYESLGGTAAYSGRGVKLDARLQQNAQQFLDARGYVPVAGLRSPSVPAAASPSLRALAADAADDEWDLTIDSTPIDLGVVQGFTTAVRDVAGVVEAHVRVTGPADTPAPEGQVTVQNGAAVVEASGVRYSKIEAQIALNPAGVHIERIGAADDSGETLTVTGDVALSNRTIGAVTAHVAADDFKVLDNELGDARIDADLDIGGDARAPEVSGRLSIASGKLNLDQLLAAIGSSPYSTQATQFETVPVDQAVAGNTPLGIYDALTADVRIGIPDDFVLQGRDLQPNEATVGLGAINLTVGGDLRATKKPGGHLLFAGTVNTVRGMYEFQGRRFEILRDGTVRFEGTEELNPALDLHATRMISGVEARVDIQGTLKEPRVDVSSTPPLERADILSLIVFNQPINNLGEGQRQSLTTRVQGMAAGALTSTLAEAVGGALDLDTFEVNLAPDSGGGPAVTLGQQVGQNLYLRVEQEFGRQSATSFVLEYEITSWLRLQTNVSPNSDTQQSLFRRVQSTGLDLISFFSF
jgi:translocation and assembly module TamB